MWQRVKDWWMAKSIRKPKREDFWYVDLDTMALKYDTQGAIAAGVWDRQLEGARLLKEDMDRNRSQK